ncbi:response regulator transcription factor [Oceanobacillus saliphilus]|uniref:response regulator transcription factor n=1 Tax=Oceanobacillus saliphilus TaxID=2925834 RepID=UPI00201D7D99|nr:response regulator transcription factor [Oceanobacillus saliphilus]
MKHETILIVEDDADIRHLLELYLVQEYRVILAADGNQAIEAAKLEEPDLILLDVMLPEKDGLEVCKEIRLFNENVPILFLSSRSEYEDRIVGLEAGADDYITKPFDPGEVLARVKAHLRRKEIASRHSEETRTTLQFGELEINLDEYTVFRNGERLQLYTKEIQLLIFLVTQPNQVFSIEQLYDHIWGEDKYGNYQTVKVHISNMRKKIEQNPAKPKFIQTVRGFGYKFSSENLKI